MSTVNDLTDLIGTAAAAGITLAVTEKAFGNQLTKKRKATKAKKSKTKTKRKKSR